MDAISLIDRVINKTEDKYRVNAFPILCTHNDESYSQILINLLK